MKKLFFTVVPKIILFLVSVTLTLFLVNLYLKLTGYQKQTFVWGWANELTGGEGYSQRLFSLDADLIYVPNPDVLNPKSSTEPVISDSYGFRPTGPVITENAKTIVTIGDSFTWGFLLQYNETYPYLLEAELRNRDLPVNVKNAGVNGYGSDQQFIYLRDRILTKVKPDVVVWNINLNDVEDNNMACLFTQKGSKFKQLSAMRNTSYIQGYLAKNLPSVIRDTELANLALYRLSPGWDRKTIGCQANTSSDKYLSPEQEKKFEFLITELIKLSQKHKFKVLVTLMPSQYYLDPSYPNDESWLQIHDELSKILEKHSPHFLAVNPAVAPRIATGNDTSVLALRQPTQPESQVLGVATGSATIPLNDFFINEGEAARGFWHLKAGGNQAVAEVVADQVEELLKN